MTMSANIAFMPALPLSSSRVRHYGFQHCARCRRGMEVSKGSTVGKRPTCFPAQDFGLPFRLVRMADTTDFPEVIKRHVGTWEGTFHFIDPKSGGTLDRHKCKLEVGIRGDRFSLRNSYAWDDGRKEVHEFAGRMIDGHLRVENEWLDGKVVVVGKDAFCFPAEIKGTDKKLFDTAVFLTENTRARVWPFVEGEKVTKIVYVEETRTSRNDTYFDKENDPFDR